MLSEIMAINQEKQAVENEKITPLPGKNHKLNTVLWSLQVLLAALFLFAGAMKLVLPIEMLTKDTPLPGLFLRFIGVAEVLGAGGLILPGLLKIRTGLTPLAAAGLLAIVIGATFIRLAGANASTAWIPLLTAVLTAVVAYNRWRTIPHPVRSLR